MQTPDTRSPLSIIALCCTLLATAGLYAIAIHGPFFLDDFINLVSNTRLRPEVLTLASLCEAAFSSDAGILQRPIAMLSFALNYAVSSDTTGFKAVNIGLHLLIGLGIFSLARTLIPRLIQLDRPASADWIAVAVAAWWLLHPLHASTVLYIVQRMTQLSSLFMLLGMLVYVYGREHMLRDNRGYVPTLLGVSIAGLLAVFSKENGALLPTLLLVIEVCAYRFMLTDAAPRWVKPTLYAALWLPTLAIITYLVAEYLRLGHDTLPGRLFSIDERLLSEAGILWRYLGWLFLVAPDGIGLFHDNITISRGLLTPATTSIAIIAWIVALGGALYGLRTAHLRHISFGILWFLAAHLLESTTLPLELAFEHRNYLAAFGPLLAVAIVLARLRDHLPASRAWITPSLFTCVIGMSAWLLSDQVLAWRSAPELSAHLVKVQPDSPRAWATLAQTLIEAGQFDAARTALNEAQALAPYEAGYPLSIAIVDCLAGNPFHRHTLDDIEQSINTPPNTAYTTAQFQNFLNHCVGTAGRQDADMLRVYTIIENSTDTEIPALKALAYYFHGRVHLNVGNRQAARSAWETVLELDPKAVLPALDLVDLLIAEQAYTEADVILMRLESEKLSGAELTRVQTLRSLIP